jgi:cyclic dehypoxanthinyl futalosine synthase
MGINREQALDCFRSDDLVGIGMEADAVRLRLHPEGVVGYAIEAGIDCSGWAGDADGARWDDLSLAIGNAVEKGAAGVRLEGLMDGTGIQELLRRIRRRFPELWVEGFSAAQLPALASRLGLGLQDTIASLLDAGLNSIADCGIKPGAECDLAIAEWCEVHRAAHGLGMQTVAGIIFGAGETAEQQMNLLEAIRGIQEHTGGFAAFAPRAADPPGGRELDGVTAVERLKTLAIARMFLDNIENVQASGTPQGLKVLQMGLRFGANDVGAVAVDGGGEEDVRRIIRDAGFRPAQREMGYRAMVLG